jgi:hypothetical protein
MNGPGYFLNKKSLFCSYVGDRIIVSRTLKSSVRVLVLRKVMVMLSTLPRKDMDSTIVTVTAPVNSLEASLILAA